jgi:hypothetical protein
MDRICPGRDIAKFIFYLSFLLSVYLIGSCKIRSSSENIGSLKDLIPIKNSDTITPIAILQDTTPIDSSLIPKDYGIKDSFLIIRRPYDPGKYNIQPFYIDFVDQPSNKLIKTIDVNAENPFVKEGYKIIPNAYSSPFFFIKIPGNGKKPELRKIFSKEVFNLIPANDSFEMAYCQFAVDVYSNKFAVIAYKVNLDYYYNESDGPGYGATRIFIYNSKGVRINHFEIEGLLISNPAISKDGKYMAFVFTRKPYGILPFQGDFNILRLVDNKVIYEEKIDSFNINEGYDVSLDRANNMIVTQFSNYHSGRILCMDSAKNLLYRSEKINDIYSVRYGYRDFVYIEFRDKPSQKLFFNKDFNLIHF